MYSDLQLAIYDPTNATGSIPLCLPSIEQVTLRDLGAIKNYVRNHENSHSFIILGLDLNDENSKRNLEDLRKEAHVFAICIHVKRGCNFTFNAGKVFPVAKQFITQKITSFSIQFFENESKKLVKKNRIFEANNLQKKANALKDQRRSINTTIRACHVIIIPINVTEDEVLEFEELVINLCNDLRDNYEVTVRKLGDYFSAEDFSDLYGNDIDKNGYALIKTVSPIRLYLFRKEIRHLPSLGQSLYESEPNDFDLHDFYIKPIFVEYQPVIEQTELSLSNVRDHISHSTNITPKLLDEIRNDIRFVTALDRANITLPQRTMQVDQMLKQLAMADSNTSIEVHGAYHIIQHGQNGNVNAQINNIIQM